MRIPLALLIILAAACSSGETASNAPSSLPFPTTTTPPLCEDSMHEGDTVTGVNQIQAPCRDAAGGVHVYAAGTTRCADGRVLLWNDLGWGYLSQPFHLHKPGAEKVAPETERYSCEPDLRPPP